MNPTVTVVDAGCGNIRSLCGALDRVGVVWRIAREADGIAGAERIILPGVGAFGRLMARLHERAFVGPLRTAAERGTPLLGICVGMQVLSDFGTEHGVHEGLGLIPGRVDRMEQVGAGSRIPHVGWNRVRGRGGRVPGWGRADETVYFTHSYSMRPADEGDVAGTFEHGGVFVAAVRRGSVTGVQFHPEKSQGAGLSLLRAFCVGDADERAGEVGPVIMQAGG